MTFSVFIDQNLKMTRTNSGLFTYTQQALKEKSAMFQPQPYFPWGYTRTGAMWLFVTRQLMRDCMKHMFEFYPLFCFHKDLFQSPKWTFGRTLQHRMKSLDLIYTKLSSFIYKYEKTAGNFAHEAKTGRKTLFFDSLVKIMKSKQSCYMAGMYCQFNN